MCTQTFHKTMPITLIKKVPHHPKGKTNYIAIKTTSTAVNALTSYDLGIIKSRLHGNGLRTVYIRNKCIERKVTTQNKLV